MGIALFKIKLMPEDTSIDLVKMQGYAKEAVEDLGGIITGFEEQDIAFGLKALVVGIRISEDVDSSKIEEVLANIEGVSSVMIIDYRRAIN
jgi:translation elongation factor aEF-1 beta